MRVKGCNGYVFPFPGSSVTFALRCLLSSISPPFIPHNKIGPCSNMHEDLLSPLTRRCKSLDPGHPCSSPSLFYVFLCFLGDTKCKCTIERRMRRAVCIFARLQVCAVCSCRAASEWTGEERKWKWGVGERTSKKKGEVGKKKFDPLEDALFVCLFSFAICVSLWVYAYWDVSFMSGNMHCGTIVHLCLCCWGGGGVRGVTWYPDSKRTKWNDKWAQQKMKRNRKRERKEKDKRIEIDEAHTTNSPPSIHPSSPWNKKATKRKRRCK